MRRNRDSIIFGFCALCWLGCVFFSALAREAWIAIMNAGLAIMYSVLAATSWKTK